MHTRFVTFVARLILACGILLALPAPAMAVPFSFTGPASVSETAGTATYTVTCGDTANPIPGGPPIPNVGGLTVAAADGPAPNATSGSDYGDISAPAFSCPPVGASTITVPITNDTLDEVNEKFTVTISGVLTVGLVPTPISTSVTTTITDDDPIASISPLVFATEGDSGTSTVDLMVTLASPAALVTTIAYDTTPFSATPGEDYTAITGDLVFQVGQTSKTISVPIIGDVVKEEAEGFFLNLLSTDNGTLNTTKKQGGVMIFDTDTTALPSVSIQKGATAQEGNSGTGNLLLTVTLSAPATEKTEVKWKTGDFSANNGADYERANGTVTFQAGQKSKTVSVNVNGDTRDEPDEAFTVTLQNPAGAVLGSQKAGFGVIEDDDGPEMGIGKSRVRGKRLITKISCPESADGCKGTVESKVGKHSLPTARFDLEKGQAQKVDQRLTRKARRALARKARRAKVTANAEDLTGDTSITKRKSRLKRRR